MTNVPVGLVPYGPRSGTSDGSYGVLLDSNGKPLASVLEVLSTLPSTDDANNFVGRLVFDISQRNIYVWTDDPDDEWIGLHAGTVLVDSPEDPTPSSPAPGDLYYSTTSEVLWLYDGTQWVAVGGRRGADVIWAHYTADGSTTLYDTTATNNPPVEFVQVFVDGLAKRPGTSSTRDYYMVGNQVQLRFTPTNGQLVTLRTLVFVTPSRNARFIVNRYEVQDEGGGFGDNGYDCGIIRAEVGQVFVTADGVTQQPDVGDGPGTYDYRISRQSNVIVELTSSGTTCTAETEEAHGYQVGQSITIAGAVETDYNGTFEITSVPSTTEFEYEADSTPSASPATTLSEITFDPLTRNDLIYFVDQDEVDTPLEVGTVVQIRAVENVTPGENTGEINEGQNLGSGAQVFKEKDGVTFQYRTLVPGSRIELVQADDTIVIDGLGDKFMRRATYNGIPSTYTAGSEDTYLGVRNSSSNTVTIDISDLTGSVDLDGRTIEIKDEAGNAGTYTIRVYPGASAQIDGAGDGTFYDIDQDYGAVKLVTDGSDFFIVYSQPGPQGDQGDQGDAGDPGVPGVWNYVARTAVTGTPDPYVVLTSDEYLAVRNVSASALTIDLETNFLTDGSQIGYRITIKDEDRNAGTYNISLDPGTGRTIEGLSSGVAYTMSSNGQDVTLVYDGVGHWSTLS